MHTITVEVRGGLVVDVTNLPPGVYAHVIDYDNDRTGQTFDTYCPATDPDPPKGSVLCAPPSTDHRNFLAFLLYASDSHRNGVVPCRWATLRDDLKEQWLTTADTQMAGWQADEEAARKRREAHDPRAFFC